MDDYLDCKVCATTPCICQFNVDWKCDFCGKPECVCKKVGEIPPLLFVRVKEIYHYHVELNQSLGIQTRDGILTSKIL